MPEFTRVKSFPVVVPCRVRDLPMFRKVLPKLRELVPVNRFEIICPQNEIPKFRSILGGERVNFIPEDSLIPGVTKEILSALDLPEFPRAAGWYFQQFLKMHYSYISPEEEYYLIWDSDTIPLRKLEFFSATGRMLLTKAEEFHKPYFETYANLLGEDAQRNFSMISQHMIVRKSRMREMIERFGDPDVPWPMSVMQKLTPLGGNRFSEYETYGHYMKAYHPDEVEFIMRPWLRILDQGGSSLPSERRLKELSLSYDFVAFERAGPLWRKLLRIIRNSINSALNRFFPERVEYLP